MTSSILIDELKDKLESTGHCLVETKAGGVGVWTPPEARITVAVYPDATLHDPNPPNYFLCAPDARAILDNSQLTSDTRETWYSILNRFGGIELYDLLAGPATWALLRLSRYEQLIVWTNGSRWKKDKDKEREDEYLEMVTSLGSPVQFKPWYTHLSKYTDECAYILPTRNDAFLNTFAAYILLCSRNFREISFTEPSFSEVYEVHHHDKVTASIPDVYQRSELLDSISGQPHLFRR